MSDVGHLMKYGQIGYNAYGNSVGWVNHTGKPMPDWEDLPFTIQRAWAMAITAAMVAHDKERSHV